MYGQLADACPRCLAINRPHSVREDRGSILAVYRCPACGRRWRCWWNPACLEVMLDDRDSPAKVLGVAHGTRG